MKTKRIFIALITLFCFAIAQVPQLINYQGYLVNTAGEPVDGTVSVEFLIYKQAGGGTAVWSEIQAITLNKGSFSTTLGAITPIANSIFNDENTYLALKVGSDPEMVPRKQLTSVGYAFKAGNTDSLSGKVLNDFVQKGEENSVTQDMISPDYILSVNFVSASGGNISLVAGDHIQISDNPASNSITISAVTDEIGDNLGNHTATENIQTNGHWISNGGTDNGIFVTDDGRVGINTDSVGDDTDLINARFESSTDEESGTAVFGEATNSTTTFNYGGVFFSRGTRGTGVRGVSYGEEGTGGVFTANGSQGVGVYGYTPGLQSTAVLGIASGYGAAPGSVEQLSMAAQPTVSASIDPVDCYGGKFQAWVDNSCGAYGYSSGLNSYGVYGEANSTGDNINYGGYFKSNGNQGYGVYGSGDQYGGYFRSQNAGSRGIYVYANGENSAAVYGSCGSTGDYIQYGGFFSTNCDDGRGIYASSSGLNSIAVYGSCSKNWAGYFVGNVNVSGTLSKTAGTFKIDHPLDPENKYLQHSFVESPDMMNLYKGNVILDGNGSAVVQMPDYFEALNIDYNYQLTCVGGYAPVYISKEISGNRFEISGGTVGLKVCWEVSGVRNDAYARNHRVEVEVEKPADEKGKYIFPEDFGRPESMKIGYEEEQLRRVENAQLEQKNNQNNN